jgi:hypothetical protein
VGNKLSKDGKKPFQASAEIEASLFSSGVFVVIESFSDWSPARYFFFPRFHSACLWLEAVGF